MSGNDPDTGPENAAGAHRPKADNARGAGGTTPDNGARDAGGTTGGDGTTTASDSIARADGAADGQEVSGAGGASGGCGVDGPRTAEAGNGGLGHVSVERSGGIAGLRLLWDVDVDTSTEQERLEARMAAVSWNFDEATDRSEDGRSGQTASAPPRAGRADRYVYVVASRHGRARLGESELDADWKALITTVRHLAEPQHLPPGGDQR